MTPRTFPGYTLADQNSVLQQILELALSLINEMGDPMLEPQRQSLWGTTTSM
jgi:hypothetical protein